MEFIAKAQRQPSINELMDVAATVWQKINFGAQGTTIRDFWFCADPKSGAGGLQSVNDVQVMRKGFGEIFPWMRG